MTEPNYYVLLQVQPNATAEEIRRAYRRRIAEVHPDKPGNADGELARAVDQARTVLLDPVARARYDARRAKEDLLDETLDALTEVGGRAIDRLSVTLQARGHDLLGALRERTTTAIRFRRRRP
jgi:curved DNA-binding protein CbpA